ncbi:MAG: DPP IV N-terminal domain-containing protein [Candidatus Schekmanbacteria bacterium]|nr:DPP IV N-terminal domain-containing protein [Candidatus Schekmanbacteria bacterium]
MDTSDFLEQFAATQRFSLGRPAVVRVCPRGSAVYFLRSGATTKERDLYRLDAASGKTALLVSAARLGGGGADDVSPEEQARRERRRLVAGGIVTYELSPDGSRLLVPLADRVFTVCPRSGDAREVAAAHGASGPIAFSPDGARFSFVRNGDLHVANLDTGEVRRLTHRAAATLQYGCSDYIAEEEMDRFTGHWWSGDGRSLACQRTDVEGVETYYLADPAHPERPPEARPYPRAGRRNADVRLLVVRVDGGGDTVEVQWDHERYPYLATVTWGEDGPLTLLVQDRRQQEELLLVADPTTGSTQPLLVERDPAWLNLDQEFPRWLSGGARFLWATERNGAWEVELRASDGTLVRKLTPRALGYQQLMAVDTEQGALYVGASPDSTETHVSRVWLDPTRGEPERLTQESGIHAVCGAPTGGLLVHTFCSLTATARYVVRRRDWSAVAELPSVAVEPARMPNAERCTATAGKRCYPALLVRPRPCDRRSRYPVVVSVYGGPGKAMVRANGYQYLLDQWLADHGFVVVSIDGRGTPIRDREWERAVRGNLIDVPLADQVTALAALGAAHPELDLDRVGIFGWSFGGYVSAMAAMRRPDVFSAAVAGAPVCDFADYDTHYTERYLGLPAENPEGYRASAASTYAEHLAAPLLLLHGTVDDNVYFQHAVKLADAIFRAGKELAFVPLSGFTHMVFDETVVKRQWERILSFFRRHLAARPAGAAAPDEDGR